MAARPAAAPAAARATCRIRRAGPSPATGAGLDRIGGVAHCPTISQAPVPGWRVSSISNQALGAAVAHEPTVVEDRLKIALGEAPGLGRECESFLQRAGPTRLASSVARRILVRM